MGILNVTPDSFSDGGRYLGVEAALDHAGRMIADGAAIVGPESTRPGALPVPAEEQIKRSIPVVEGIRRVHPDVTLSIDTRLSAVAAAALDAGADIINDTSALREDPAMAELAARRESGVVLMHMQGEPATMQNSPAYGDVVQDVKQFLADRIAFATSRGIARSRIIIDPGIGFGKTAKHNVELIRRIGEIVALDCPVLVGVSRKSTIRGFVGDDDASIVAGSLACALACALGGARLIRAHDVGATVQWLRTSQPMITRGQ
jgi:dihydropteroate synthase